MQDKGQFENGIIFQHNMKILKNEEYQYFYKVNSEQEKEFRQYKYDSDLEMGVDEWNKIWIGYRFNYQDKMIQQQFNQVNISQKPIRQFLQNFKLVENINIQEGLEIQMKNDQMDENNKLMNGLMLRSNYLIFEFSDDLIYTQHQKSIVHFDEEFYSNFKYNQSSIIEELTINMNLLRDEIVENQMCQKPVLKLMTSRMKDIRIKLETLKSNLSRIDQYLHSVKLYLYRLFNQIKEYEDNKYVQFTENIDFQEKLKKEIEFQQQRFEEHQKIYQTYTNNMNSVLEKLIQDTNYISDQQIESLLTPIEIPQIKDPVFENCKQSLIIINNKLNDLKQNKQIIQGEFDTLKIAYAQSIQKLDDFEWSIQKNDKYQNIIQKLKQKLIEKQEEIEKLKKEQNKALIQYRIRIEEAKEKFHKDISLQQLQEQKLINQIESQNEKEKQLGLDTQNQILLLEIEKSKSRNLNREKDSFIKNQSDYIASLLKIIQNYKELSNIKV